MLLLESGLSSCYSALFVEAYATKKAIVFILCGAVYNKDRGVPLLSLELVPYIFFIAIFFSAGATRVVIPVPSLPANETGFEEDLSVKIIAYHYYYYYYYI